MSVYQIRFVKKLCDDYGRKHDCVQADVQIKRARTAARALRAAKLKFQRWKRTGHWWTHADNIELRDVAAIGDTAPTKLLKPISESSSR
jgi:hypothetical protein